MKYGVFGKSKKAIAITISIALAICASPVMPASAEAATGTKVTKQVNFGVINDSIAPSIDKDKITLSISSGFAKKLNMAQSKVEAEPFYNATSWILAEEKSENSMEASVNGDKIILAEGYDEDANHYLSHIIKAEHKKASDVLGSTSEVSALISTEDKEVLYYGKIDSATSDNAGSSSFILPRGLEKGKYNLYIFAENSSASIPKTVYTSKLGEPISIEVVSSIGLDIEGVEEPEPGNTPDTEAVLKVMDGDNVIQEEIIGITWLDELGNEVTGKFLYNRDYIVNIDLEKYITGYIFGEDIAKVNNESAEFITGYGSYTSYNVHKRYKTSQLDCINISGVVGSDDKITLKAYKGIIPPAPSEPDGTEYTYEWWNSNLNTSLPAYTGQSHVLTSDDFDIDMELKLNTSEQGNVASKVIKIRGGLLETSVIEGVSKTDELIKGKSDGSLEGLTSEMKYSLDGGSTYNTCKTDKIENIPAGTICRVKIEKNNLTPVGVTGIYAEYKIGEGRPLSVSFDSNSGSSVNKLEDIAYNSVIKEPSIPVKDGYQFGGWYKNPEFNDKWDFSNDKVTENITLFAKWNKNQEENPGNQTAEPGNTAKPGNTKKPEGTKEPGNTTKPEGTKEPGNTKKPEGTKEPGNTKKPEGTKEPGNTTKPEGTTKPTKKPSGNNSVLTPYVPQVPSIQTSSAPVPQVPAQTAEPENKPSQNPGEAAATAPVTPATQAPPANNTKEDNTPAGTNQPADAVDKEDKVVLGNIEFQGTGDGDFVISGTDTGTAKDIVIPDTVCVGGKKYKVTKIAKKAFAGTGIKSVVLSGSITEIGDGAFKGCRNLKTVKFSSGTKTIGKGAFRDCKSLKNAKLPNSVKSIGKNAFMKKFVLGTPKKVNNNKKLALRFGASVAKVSIGANALENCVELRSVVINSQVTKIGNSTFKYCTQLRKMLVKSLKLQKVGNKALQGVHNCKITVPPVKIKPYTTLFKNKGQGKKVVVAKS